MFNNYLNRPRRKAWIGAAIGAGVGLVSSIFGASSQRRAQQKQANLQRNTQAREAGVQSAANLTKAFANYNELDQEFQNRFLRYGGRRKAELGIEETQTVTPSGGGSGWSANDTSDVISGVGSAIGNIAGSLIANNVKRSGESFIPVTSSIRNAGSNKAVYDSAARSSFLNNYYQTTALRMGGRKQSRRC